jgi:hypothetical protein
MAPRPQRPAQRPVDPQPPPQRVEQPHRPQRPRAHDVEQLADLAAGRRLAVRVARDRRRQPPQPVEVEAVLAAQVDQHLGLRDPIDAPVVRQLHVAHHRPILVAPLRRAQIHAHTISRPTATPQVRHA